MGSVFFIALSLRLTYQNESVIDHPIRADAREYFLAAYNLYKFDTYSTKAIPPDAKVPPKSSFGRPPGYPLFLYPLVVSSRTLPDFLYRVGVAQAVVGSLTAVMSYILARLILINLPFSLLAALLTAFSPHLIAMDQFVLSESLFTFLAVMSAILVLLSWQKKSGLFSLFAGLSCGFLVLIRPAALLFGPFLGIVYLIHPRKGRRNPRDRIFRHILFFVIGYIGIYGPFLFVRNTASSGSLGISNQKIWKKVVNGYDIDLEKFLESKYRPVLKKQRERMWLDIPYAIGEFKRRFVEKPLSYMRWYLGGKVLFLWKWDNFYNGDVYQYPMVKKGFAVNATLSKIHRLMFFLHWPLYSFTLASPFLLFLSRRYGGEHEKPLGPIVPLLSLVYFVGLFTLLVPLPRYGIPLRPFSYVMAMFFLFITVQLIRTPFGGNAH